MSTKAKKRFDNEVKEPEDIGLVVGSKKQAFLEDVRDKVRVEEENCRFTAELDRGFLKVLGQLIEKEKEKFK
jgi:hypothetical protein